MTNHRGTSASFAEYSDLHRETAILTIAGSDPSGGAGIQADIKTITSLGVYCGAAITCLTAQNTLGVEGFVAVDPDFVKKQITMVLADLPVSHVKTGMIGTAGIATAITEALADFNGEIICDPVLTASDGHILMHPADIPVLSNSIINLATVLTPNLPELALLADLKIHSQDDTDQAAGLLFNRFARLRVIVAKGGHGPHEKGEIVDTIYLKEKSGASITKESIPHPFIDTPNTHGTGCTFASAFTAFHLLSGNYLAAFHDSVHYMNELLTRSAAKTMGRGKGPLFHHLTPKFIDIFS